MYSCVTSGSWPSALTITWMWAGRHGLQSQAAVILPVGPSSGIVYGPGMTVRTS